jgi:hypothetical protein
MYGFIEYLQIDTHSGTGDYTFFCDDGDNIETYESVQLTPVHNYY